MPTSRRRKKDAGREVANLDPRTRLLFLGYRRSAEGMRGNGTKIRGAVHNGKGMADEVQIKKNGRQDVVLLEKDITETINIASSRL